MPHEIDAEDDFEQLLSASAASISERRELLRGRSERGRSLADLAKGLGAVPERRASTDVPDLIERGVPLHDALARAGAPERPRRQRRRKASRDLPRMVTKDDEAWQEIKDATRVSQQFETVGTRQLAPGDIAGLKRAPRLPGQRVEPGSQREIPIAGSKADDPNIFVWSQMPAGVQRRFPIPAGSTGVIEIDKLSPKARMLLERLRRMGRDEGGEPAFRRE